MVEIMLCVPFCKYKTVLHLRLRKGKKRTKQTREKEIKRKKKMNDERKKIIIRITFHVKI